MSYFTPEQKAALYAEPLRSEVDPADSFHRVQSATAESQADCAAGRATDADVNLYLPGDLLVKIDIATMSNSLEAHHGDQLWTLIRLENWHRTFATPSQHCVAEMAR